MIQVNIKFEKLNSFKSLGWYFDNYYDVKRTCDLPLKSICLSEGVKIIIFFTVYEVAYII